MKLSDEKVGYTSNVKICFLHTEETVSEPVCVPTEFPITEDALKILKQDFYWARSKFGTYMLNGQVVVMTYEESVEHLCPEVWITLVKGKWKPDEGVLSHFGYKKAMKILGYDGRKKDGKPLEEWLDRIGISESAHKKYSSAHLPVPRVLAISINTLLELHHLRNPQ